METVEAEIDTFSFQFTPLEPNQTATESTSPVKALILILVD